MLYPLSTVHHNSQSSIPTIISNFLPIDNWQWQLLKNLIGGSALRCCCQDYEVMLSVSVWLKGEMWWCESWTWAPTFPGHRALPSLWLATAPLGQYLHSLSQHWQCLSPGHDQCLSDPGIAANSKPHFRHGKHCEHCEHTEKWKECLNSWQSTLEMSWRNQTYRQTIFYSLTQYLCNMNDWNIALMTKTVIFIWTRQEH